MNGLFIVNFNNFISQNQRNSFKDAARRWKCEYFEITEADLQYSGHPGAIKTKAYDLTDADRLVILDADTIIRSDVPSPFELFPRELFCAVQNKQPQLGPHVLGQGALIEKIEMGYIFDKYPYLDFDYNRFFNSGMIVCSREHADILSRAHEIYSTVDGLNWWDQTPLNYAVAESKFRLELIPLTWNYCYPSGPWDKMSEYVYHFAGRPERYEILPQINWLADNIRGRPDLVKIWCEMGYKTGVEIGVKEGEFSRYILQNWPGFLFLVDPWCHQSVGYTDIANTEQAQQEKNLVMTLSNTYEFGRSQIVRDFSLEAARGFSDGSLDFIYLDANHAYENVLEDLHAWYPKVRSGGMISGHDFLDGLLGEGNFGVRSAVFEFIQGKSGAIHVNPNMWYDWYFIKE